MGSSYESSKPPNKGSDAGALCGGKTPCPPPPPPPVLEIVDRKTGVVVSGTTSHTKIVGQKIELLVRTKPPGHVLTNIRWTVAAETVKTYTQSTAAGTRTDLAFADLNGVNLDFYWISKGNKAVQVTADVDGATQSSSVTYNVLAPTAVSMTSVTGAVAVSNPGFPGAGLELHFGTNATPGISWTLTATAPAGGVGQIAGTQLINITRTRDPNVGARQTLSSGGAYVLDDGIPTSGPYANLTVAIASGATATWNTDDSPGSPLSSGFKKATASDQFRIYFMYRPDGADSIWVTLKRLDWNWGGETTRVLAPPGGNTWNPPTGVANSTNPSGTDTTELPTWTANFTSLSFH